MPKVPAFQLTADDDAALAAIEAGWAKQPRPMTTASLDRAAARALLVYGDFAKPVSAHRRAA